MAEIKVVPSTPDDVAFLSSRLRSADADELSASLGCSPEQALSAGLEGTACLTWFSPEGHPVAMGGVAPTGHDGLGAVWLMSTDEIERLRFTFLRNVRDYLDAIHSIYPTLFNYVDARNELHIRWLRWMGFTFLRRVECHGHEGRPFYEFVRIKHV